VGNDADSHKLLSVVTAVHHQRVGETLDDGALRLSESLLGVSTGRVGDVDGSADLDIIAANLLALLALSSMRHAFCSFEMGILTSRRYHGFRHLRRTCRGRIISNLS